MSVAPLLKGFEVELFTGQSDGTVVGVAEAAAASLEGFVTEPDHRNLEYTTPPMPTTATSSPCCWPHAAPCAPGLPAAASPCCRAAP